MADEHPITWRSRARSGLNRLVDRINEIEEKGGLGAAVQRGWVRVKQEQQRILHEAQTHGPLAEITKIRLSYARLEVPFGSDYQTVRTAYRKMMRKYHPDRHAADPEREKVATEISQKLTVAYGILEKHLNP